MAYLASDYEVTYQGDGTGNQKTNRNKPCVQLTELDYDTDGNIAFNFGNRDAAAKTIGIRLKAKGSQPAGDFLWNPEAVTSKEEGEQLVAATDFSYTVEEDVVTLAFTPDPRGVSQEIWIDGEADPLFVLPIGSKAEPHRQGYGTAVTYKHRTIGDGTTTLTSQFVDLIATVPAAPELITPNITVSSTYNEADPAKLTATHVITLSVANNVSTYLNLRKSNSSTGLIEREVKPIVAGDTSATIVYNYTYANLAPEVKEVLFQVEAGEGYTVSAPVSTHQINYTPPTSADHTIAMAGAWGRGGSYSTQVQSNASGYLFKSGTGVYQREAYLKWGNFPSQTLPLTLRLTIANYTSVQEGVIEVYAMQDFNPSTITFDSAQALIGATPIASSQFKPNTLPFIDINLPATPVSGTFCLCVKGVGMGSSAPYEITRVDSANPPTLTEAVVTDRVDIRTYGTLTGDDTALMNTAIANTQAQGKYLLIPDGVEVVCRTEVASALDDVKIWIEPGGKLSGYEPNPIANDWRRLGVAATGQEYTASTVPSAVRTAAESAGYRLLTLTGKRCRIEGGGEIDGKFDNAAHAGWGATSGTELVGIEGDDFFGRFTLRNAAGTGIELAGNNPDVILEAWNCAYANFRLNTKLKPMTFAKVSVTGGKESLRPESRSSVASFSGNNVINKVLIPEMVIENGSFLIDSAAGSTGTSFFPDVEIGLLDMTMERDVTYYPSGDPASSNLAKYQNTGVITISKSIERSVTKEATVQSLWANDMVGKLTILERDTNLSNFRPAPDTYIKLVKHVRTSSYLPTNKGWYYPYNGTEKVVIDSMVIENNGYGDMASTFAIFNIGGSSSKPQNPNLWIKSITNNGGAKIYLERSNSYTGSGCIRYGVGLTVAQQITALQAMNIIVRETRLLTNS